MPAGGNIDIYAGNVTGGPSSGGIVAEILNQQRQRQYRYSSNRQRQRRPDSIFAQDGCVTTAGNVTTFHPAGTGNVTVTTGTNADITGTSRWGLYADTNGTGSVSVTTQSGTSISSGSSGIVAINQAPASVNFTGASSSINVTANGTINSGSSANPNGAEPAGIDAGYFNSNAVGSVAVDNYADIEAGNGSGISAFMYGTGAGNVTVNDHAGNITALNAATGVTLGASNPVGIRATSDGTGSITVSTAAGTDINAGSDGILAKNQSTLIPSGSNSQVSVTAHGTIESGTIVNNDGSQPAGILAVYGGNGSSTSSPNTSVYGNISVDNFANITAAGGDGIRAANYGVGNVTVTDETSTSIKSSAEYEIDATNYESGNISVSTASGDDVNSSSGGTGIRAINGATTTSGLSSTITVTAYGTIESGTAADAKFPSLSPAGILAAYVGVDGIASTTPTANANVLGSITVYNHAAITASSGDGIAALDYGLGSVTVDNYASGNVTGPVGLSHFRHRTTQSQSTTRARFTATAPRPTRWS